MQALARLVCVLLPLLSATPLLADTEWVAELLVDVLLAAFPLFEELVRHLSKDKCCLALLSVERNCELR